MPPRGPTKLSNDARALLRPRGAARAGWASEPLDTFRDPTDRRAGSGWWSLQPVRAVKPPEVGPPDGPLNEIDYFLLQNLDRAGRAPAPPADPRTLIRRLYFDLIGLP